MTGEGRAALALDDGGVTDAGAGLEGGASSSVGVGVGVGVGSGPRQTRRSTNTVTLTDVAQHARVSPQTVSRSIRSPELVSEFTLERVRNSIAETGYVPNLAASNLASNRSMTVAAVIPAVSASVFADALHGLEEVLSPAGYQLFIGSTDYRPSHEEELVRALLGRRPDGIFIVGTKHSPNTTHLLRESRVPVVEAWDLTDDPIDSVVGFSNRDAISALVQFAVTRGYAHPTFAGSFQTGDFRAIARRGAFEDSVRELYPGEPIRVVDSGTATVDFETGRRLLDETLTTYPETDVLMFASDVFAAGAVLECARRGIRIPGDIAITGFGDFEISRHLVPTLTTVAVPNRQIGTIAGELLLARMTHRPVENSELDLGFSVVARESA
ncbi:LacI family DNA-binding transcriptional regulator [Herbiconiux daphne]|uniref:LacI family DNA-binding transcriptional regulator n=1 Tax=Herbiconiux daphne TaxID=2970914 RepID=A0ABT2H7R9_9MICO|nr:LacI family DNA-binding transcriptional regulator [Herbiconiux daphne]MCS5735978.1 LacI family DNA-binding transcriptional regulator [Herbiconiux daphne]